jgi:hypothetical protein
MKNKFKILFLASIGILLLVTCKKDPSLNMPNLSVAVIPKVTKDATKDQNVSFLNLAGFKGSVIVDLYYKDQPSSMDLMVCMNGDVAKTALVKAGITSYPTSTDFTVANMVGLVPGLTNISQIKLGDYFKFYVDMTLPDGTVVKGNDPVYASANTSIANLPGSSLNVKYTVACALDQTKISGSYRAKCADWGVDGNVTITKDPVDPYKIYVAGLETIDGLTEDKGPLPMHINPTTFAVTVDKTVLASLVTWGPPYHNIAYAGSGTYDTCTGTYNMKFTISVTEGNFGDFDFTLTKN